MSVGKEGIRPLLQERIERVEVVRCCGRKVEAPAAVTFFRLFILMTFEEGLLGRLR